MSLELAFAFAVVLGRVLVLPPKFSLYLLEPSHLGDYFDLDDLRRGAPVIMFEDWLDKIGHPRPEELNIPPERHLHPIW